MASKRNNRPDHQGTHRAVYEKNRKRILASQTCCGICGKPVDKTLPKTDPASAVVDHILPVSKGGHPSDINNLQLAHRSCNRWKGDKLPDPIPPEKEEINNRDLPLSMDWKNYRAKEKETHIDL